MVQRKDSFRFLKAQKERTKATRIGLDETGGAAFLGVLVQKKKYHIPLGQIREIIPAPKITAIGHTKPWLSGLLKVQGEIYSVIDVAPFVNLPIVEQKKPVVIALTIQEGNYAILVSSVLGITKINQLNQVNTDEFIVTYQSPDKGEIPALSVQSIIKSTELTNMSIF